MSDSRRTTRRAAHRTSTRQTLRQQRGGAAWSAAAIPDTSEARRAEWAAALAGTKFEGLASPSTAPAPSNRAEKERRLELYFRCLEDLDGLFAIAVKLIKKSRGIADNAQLIQSVERLSTREAKTEAAQYIFDVVRFALFTDDRVIDPGVGATKIQEILLSDSDETLPMMLLYPERFSNVLLKTLGQLIVGALTNPRMLQDAASVALARPILAAQMESYAQSHAYTYTARPLRDGFYIGQTVREFRKIMMEEAGRDPNIRNLISEATGLITDKCVQRVSEIDIRYASSGAARPATRLRDIATRPEVETKLRALASAIKTIEMPSSVAEKIPSVLVARQNRTGQFWKTLADEMVASLAITDTAALFRDIDATATAGCPSTLLADDEPWAKLVARIHRFYTLAPPAGKNQRGLLALLAGEACGLPDIPDPDHEYQYSPDREYLVDTSVRGVDYGRLAKRMRTSILQFILQLTFNIDKALAAAAST